MYSYDSQKEIGASWTMTSTSDGLIFTPAVAVEIVSWGVIVTTALSGTAMVVTGDKRITAGSDTGRITGSATAAFGIMTLTAAQVTAGVAGSVLRNRPVPNEPATGATSVETGLYLYPGQQLVLRNGTAMSTTGIGLPFVEYKYAPLKQQLSAASNLTLFGVSAKIGLGNEIEQDS